MVDALVRFECVAIFTVHLHCQRSGPSTSTVLQLVRVLVRRYWSPVREFVQCAGALLAIVTAKRNNVFLSGVTMFQLEVSTGPGRMRAGPGRAGPGPGRVFKLRAGPNLGGPGWAGPNDFIIC